MLNFAATRKDTNTTPGTSDQERKIPQGKVSSGTKFYNVKAKVDPNDEDDLMLGEIGKNIILL